MDETQFRSKYLKEQKAAADELAKYYSVYFRLPASQAETDARAAVSAAIAGAYDLCE